MKRVLTSVIALAFAVGALAPAVFAADLPALPTNTDNLSIWDTSTSTPENPYNTTDVFNIVNDMWGDLFDDGRFNNTSVSDFQRPLVEWAITKYIEAAPDEELNGATVSYFDEIVDYVCAHPADFDLYWTPDALSLALAGDPYGSLTLGDNFFDNLYDYVIANFYSSPSPDRITTNSGGVWIKTPFSYSSYRMVGSTSSQGVTNTADVYVSIKTGSGAFVASYYTSSDSAVYFNQAYINSNTGAASFAGGGALGNTFTYNGTSYKVLNSATDFFRSAFGSFTGYANYTAAFNDFYGYVPDSEPVSNGKVYIRDEPIGGNSLTFNYPAYPVSNSKAVSNYYYNTYGDSWEDNSTIIDDSVYNNNLTTLYPVTYENNIPLWLIQSNSTIETFDYSLELPSAPLETLPSDFEGGGSFFQNSFVVLGGFGAFVLVGLSFSLVGLFFKE